jgi:hypothetical protein
MAFFRVPDGAERTGRANPKRERSAGSEQAFAANGRQQSIKGSAADRTAWAIGSIASTIRQSAVIVATALWVVSTVVNTSR